KFQMSRIVRDTTIVKVDIQDPVVLEEMKKMKDFLESKKDVHNPQSVVDIIEEMSDVMDEGKTIPDSKDKVSNLWFLLEEEEIMSQLVNPAKTEAIIQATITNMNTARTWKLLENIEEYIKEVNNSNVIFAQTLMPSIYQNLDNSIMLSQIQSIIIAVVLVFICLMFMMRSFIGGLIGLVPIGFALLIIFGFMGFSSIPLDVATVLVRSVPIGIGIDYSIHFFSRFRKEFKKAGTELEALDKTLETTCKAIFINVITVTMGFFSAHIIQFGSPAAIWYSGCYYYDSFRCWFNYFIATIILLTRSSFIGNFDRFINKAVNY
ncbi:TPA: hypothetical protein DCW38_06005, partial [candidate division WOR-3 bacterium]|nr:hypothetical protein [candidate division WOR-3 bacterium]